MAESETLKPKKSAKRAPRLTTRIARLKRTAVWVILSFLGGIVIAVGLLAESVQKIGALFPQAAADADQIAKLRERIESQAATVDLVALKATKAELVASGHTATINGIAQEATLTRSKLDGVSREASQLRTKIGGLAQDTSDMRSRMESIDSTVAVAKSDLKDLHDGTQRAKDDLARVLDFTRMQKLVLAAQADSRTAFDSLQDLVNDTKFPFHDEARNAWWMIVDEHDAQIQIGPPEVDWSPLIDPKRLTFEQLKKELASARVPRARMSLISYIWSREDISKADRMHFLAQLIPAEQSLRVLAFAVGLFDTEAKIKKKRLLVSYYLDWWEIHTYQYPLSTPDSTPPNGLMPILPPVEIGGPQPPAQMLPREPLLPILPAPIIQSPKLEPLPFPPKLELK